MTRTIIKLCQLTNQVCGRSQPNFVRLIANCSSGMLDQYVKTVIKPESNVPRENSTQARVTLLDSNSGVHLNIVPSIF